MSTPLQLDDCVTAVVAQPPAPGTSTPGGLTLLAGCVFVSSVDVSPRIAGTSIVLLAHDEGVKWIRGWHKPDSEPAQALLATAILLRSNEDLHGVTGPQGATGPTGPTGPIRPTGLTGPLVSSGRVLAFGTRLFDLVAGPLAFGPESS